MFSCLWRTLEVQFGHKDRNDREVIVQFLIFLSFALKHFTKSDGISN